MWAWIEDGCVRDIAPGLPSEFYHHDVAPFYSVEIPEGVKRGAIFVDGEWVNPEPPPVVEPPPPPPPPLPPEGQLSVLRWTIPADASESAQVTYTASDTVHFLVDGVIHSVEPIEGVATLEIFANAPGAIPIEVRDKSAMITAVEV